MLKQLKQASLATLVLIALTGAAYPLLIAGIGQALFPSQAHGSLIARNGQVVGSALIGQDFTKPDYFHPRPSATTAPDPAAPDKTIAMPYNAASSAGSNAAPSAQALADAVADRLKALQAENPDAGGPVPIDLLTASASGLDPDISLAGALYQAPRVAAARQMPEAALRRLIERHVHPPFLGFLGERRVNVLELNLALDEKS